MLIKLTKKKQNPLSFSIKNNKKEIADLLVSYGAIPVKLAFDKKSSSKKKKEVPDNNLEKMDSISNANLKIKAVLIKIVDGKKIPLTSSDLEEFQKLNPEVFDLLNNPEELENIDKDSSDSIKFPEAWEKIAKK